MLDSDGNTVASYTYDAWGRVLTATGSMAIINPLRYRGYVYDHETGLYYLQSRYYNPELGRFINADAYASTGQGFIGNNMFAYCGNNPVIFKDASGEFFLTAIIVIGAGFLVGAGTGAYIAACDGGSTEDIIEGAIEGALTGAASAGIGLVAPNALVAFGAGAFAGSVIDVGVQTTSYAIRNGSLDGFNLDELRVVETALTTGISAMVPTFNNTLTDTSMAVGTALVSAEASVLISSTVIIAHQFRAKLVTERRMTC